MIPKNTHPLLCFFGHHKCGTQWIQGILREIGQELGLKYNFASEPSQFKQNLQAFLASQKTDIFSFTNSEYEYVKNLSDFRGFHVVRDPRDIAISGYFSHLYSHPTEQATEHAARIQEQRDKLQALSKDEGLLQEIEFESDVFNAMYSWNYSQENVLEVKMEDLMANAYNVFMEIFRFLGVVGPSRPQFTERWGHVLSLTLSRLQEVTLHKTIVHLPLRTLPSERILGIVYEHDFKKKTRGRKPGEEDAKSHYRKGIPGDWKNHFKQEHIDLFKSKYNDLLIKLEYEKDENW
jgi:Sulfotransferase domain